MFAESTLGVGHWSGLKPIYAHQLWVVKIIYCNALFSQQLCFFLLSVSIIVSSAIVTFYNKHPSAVFP